MSNHGGSMGNVVPKEDGTADQLRLIVDPEISSRWTAEIWVTALTQHNISEGARYVKISGEGNVVLGLFEIRRVVTPNSFNVKISTKAEPASRSGNGVIELTAATKNEFEKYQADCLKPARCRARAGLALLVIAAAIQVSWDVGKVAPLFHPGTGLVVAALAAKYVTAIGGAVLAYVNDFPRP